MSETIAQMVARALIENGIHKLYCLPGVQNDPFFDAIFDQKDQLKPIHTRHEQAACYMALGAAMGKGLPQAYCVVPGPGFLNTTAALSTAYALNAPVLAIIGQNPIDSENQGHGLLHEIPKQLEILKTLTKSAFKIHSQEDAVETIKKAFESLVSGRPGPVGLEISTDLWRKVPANPHHRFKPSITRSLAVDLVKIEQSIDLICQSRSPMIVIGGGAQNDPFLVRSLAEKIGAPTVAFRNGHGIVPSDSDYSINMPTAHSLWDKVDLVIGLGTRLQSQVMGWGYDQKLKIIHIDVDDNQLGKSSPVDVGINGSIHEVLPVMIANLPCPTLEKSDWLEYVNKAKTKTQNAMQDRLGEQVSWLQAIRKALPKNGIFVEELTQMGYVARFAFATYQPRTFISTGYQGTLGFGFPTALGVADARRDIPVVAISGDGGFLFNAGELATAVLHKIPLTTVIFNNNSYGNIRLFQKTLFKERYIASELENPDFVALAESFGVMGVKVNTPEKLASAMKKSFNNVEPTLIEVPVGEFSSPWDFILLPKVRG